MVVILVIVGLIFGSFVNALVWRMHKQEERTEQVQKSKRKQQKTQDLSILTGRSMCTNCSHELAAKDLIPVVSYLWLHGRCRYCGKPIEDSPLAELVTPALFALSYLWWPYSLIGGGLSMGKIFFIFWLIFLVGFTALALYDMRWFLLPDRIVFPLIALAVFQVLLTVTLYGAGMEGVASAAGGVLIAAGLFFAIFEISDGSWIGFGDVKLAVVLGLLVGGPMRALLLLFVASLLGSLVALPLLLRGKANARTPLPFGPFLLAATVVVVLFGSHLTGWYVGLLHVQ